MDNWNDLKLVLAIQRSGSLGGGAALLKIDHSTAFRRLNALEKKLGTRLFERLPAGVYLPTPLGQKAGQTAERVETETNALDRDITGEDRRLVGNLRVTSSETLAYQIVMQQLVQFRARHPGITVELLVDNRILSLSRREADIALRVARPREPDLFGRKLADVAWTIYARPELLRGHVESAELWQLPFVGWTAETTGVAASDWLTDILAPEAIVYRANSLISQFSAAREGIGLAVLPCYLADPEPDLVRAIQQPIPELTRELWMVTHADLQRTARVRAFFDSVGQGLSQQQKMFAGLLD